MKKFLLCFLFVFLSLNLFLNNKLTAYDYGYHKPQEFIGPSLYTFSSIGLSYHSVFGQNDEFTAKTTFFIYPKRNQDGYWFFIGEELQFGLYSSRFSRIYFLFGIGYNGLLAEEGDVPFSFGPGFGTEFVIFRTIAFNIDLGITFNKNPYSSKQPFILGPGIGLGLSYAF